MPIGTVGMEATEVLRLLGLFQKAGVGVWLDGGWAVDALLGAQTRSHADLDIVIQTTDVPKLRELLSDAGYQSIEREDIKPWNFVLRDPAGREVDSHAIVFDEFGNGLYGPPELGEAYPSAALLGQGMVEALAVRCISAEYMVRFIAPWLFKRREKNIRDVTALCERFGISFPAELRAVL